MRGRCRFFSLCLIILLCFLTADLSRAQTVQQGSLQDQQKHEKQQQEQDEQEYQQKRQQQTDNLHALEGQQQAGLSGAPISNSNFMGNGSRGLSRPGHQSHGAHSGGKKNRK